MLLALLGLAQAPLAHAAEVTAARIGINRLNLAWLSRSDQERVLGEMAANGITHARLSLSRPVDKSIEGLEIASRLGIRILLEVQLTNKSYFPETARPRTGFGRIWDVHRLSELDLDRYRMGLRDALRRIDALGIRLEAIEPGNEINFSAYNGDLLVYRRPGERTPRSIADLAGRAAFEQGLDKYLEAVKITREEVRRYRSQQRRRHRLGRPVRPECRLGRRARHGAPRSGRGHCAAARTGHRQPGRCLWHPRLSGTETRVGPRRPGEGVSSTSAGRTMLAGPAG